MFIVISYDIVNNRTRYRLAKVMINYGCRVQKSVFECDLDDRRFLEMKGKIEKLIDREKDSVRYYFMCRRCRGSVEVSGLGTVREDDDVIIV